MSDTTKILLELPDDLHRELKSRAPLAGTPLYQFTVDILRDSILPGKSNPAPIQSATVSAA